MIALKCKKWEAQEKQNWTFVCALLALQWKANYSQNKENFFWHDLTCIEYALPTTTPHAAMGNIYAKNSTLKSRFSCFSFIGKFYKQNSISIIKINIYLGYVCNTLSNGV